jgi:hypothetical protein
MGNFVSELVENKRVVQFMDVQSDGLELFKKKNADYGDAFAQYGVIGVLIRIQDKIQRAVSISKNNIELVDDEKIEDTLIDLHNYAAMALILLKEQDYI